MKGEEKVQAEFLLLVSLSLLPSQKLSFSPGKKKKYPAIPTTSELSQPYSNENTQLTKKMNWTKSAGV